MPVAVFNYLFAQTFQRHAEEVAGAIVVSTLVSFAALPFLVGGCASRPVSGPAMSGPAIQACERLFATVDALVARQGVGDPGGYRIPGFPYLRTNRFLAELRDAVRGRRFEVWLGRLAGLDRQGRRFELANLPRAARVRFAGDIGERLDTCRGRLVDRDLASPARRALLRRNARAPDEYSLWKRVVGIYPVTALFVSFRINMLQGELGKGHRGPVSALPVAGRLRRWGLPAGRVDDGGRGPLPVDDLGVPRPDGRRLEALFRRHAPVWEIDERDGDDRPGSPVWSSGRVRVDVRRPALYRWVSATRYGEVSLLQLNYLVWFPRRPGDDLYAGELDGVIWRVTLGPDGAVWLYDSIHACGCYHVVFPTPALPHGLARRRWFTEDLLIARTLPARPVVPLVLRIAAGTHYLVHVDPAHGPLGPVSPLAVDDYDALRSLPYVPPERPRRGLFGPDGLVPGSERRERFVLWPMGVPSPGAMRIAGRHAVAFIGRRHFDDARLVEEVGDALEWVRPRGAVNRSRRPASE